MKAILSNSTRKLLRFDITKMLIAGLKNKFIVPFLIIFGTLQFPIATVMSQQQAAMLSIAMMPLLLRYQ